MGINERIAAEEKEIWDNPFDSFTRRLNAITDRDEYERENVDYAAQVRAFSDTYTPRMPNRVTRNDIAHANRVNN